MFWLRLQELGQEAVSGVDLLCRTSAEFLRELAETDIGGGGSRVLSSFVRGVYRAPAVRYGCEEVLSFSRGRKAASPHICPLVVVRLIFMFMHAACSWVVIGIIKMSQSNKVLSRRAQNALTLHSVAL